jgi:tetratricopeptide (TPR) repeat protein
MAKLHGISEACKDPQRKADVVFIHGLGGDAFGTWRHGDDDETSWPHWLANAFADVGVWSLEHAADPSKPLGLLTRLLGRGGRDAGQGMSLPDRAGQILDLMRLEKHFRGERPIVFVCHSLGGLLAKQILRQAHDNAGNTGAESISRRTAGVLFLATPHNGADLAMLADKFAAICGPTASLAALKAHDPHLRNLYNWYRNHAPTLGIETETYFEARDVFGFRIVDETSSQPGVGPDAVMLDEDHLSIAKPRELDAQVCRALEEMLRKVLSPAGLSSAVDALPTVPLANPPAVQPLLSTQADTSSAPAPAESPIPRDLQPPGYAFRGRSQLLDALVQRLEQGRSTAVAGDAGMGKTALVVEALQRLLGREPGEQQASLSRSRFADGIVFLDLYRHHGQAEPAWGALATERGESTKDSGGNEIPALQRAIAACTGKRLLLVVEGGEEARGTTEADGFVRSTRAALLDPLPLQQSTVLWLSRRSDQWSTHDTLSLDDPLGDEDARALFDELATDPATGASRVAPPLRDRALTLLHGHPLAITWTAALMAGGNVVTADLLADLAEQPSLSLHDPQQKAHTLAWLFDRSLRGLGVDARRSLLAAGLLAADAFPRAAIAAATGLDDRAQRLALEACLAARLLRLDEAAGEVTGAPSYRFGHALAYSHAREQARAESDVAALLSGLAEWAHGTLKVGLVINAPPAATVAVPRTLAHALVLLAADTAQVLWRPLVNALLYNFSDRFVELGQLTPAVATRHAVERWLDQAQAAQPEAVQWWREGAACHDRLGYLDLTQGDLSGAQHHYEAALAIAERLAAQDPENPKRQRDLSISRNKLGSVQEAQGDLFGAQRHYEADLAIVKRLAGQDPTNAELQRDLGVSHNKLGNVQQMRGDLPDAQRHFAAGLAIAERLAVQDPANAQWQRDLSISHIKLGEVQQAQVALPGAQRHYEAGLAIVKRLAAQDPTNAELQRDLGVSHNKLGDVQQAQSDLPSAQRHYEAGLAIAERLAAKVPANAQWQRDLAVSHIKLGEVQQTQGDMSSAQRHYTAALAITERLAAQNSANAGWQRDLAVSRIKLSGICEADGDASGALTHLQVAHTILQTLWHLAPDHPHFQGDLASVEHWIAVLEGRAPS